MSWLKYIIIIFLCGFLQMLFGPRMVFPGCNGEYLFLIAFHTALNCPPRHVIPVFFLAGIASDIFISKQPGASALLFTLCGITVRFISKRTRPNQPLKEALIVFLLLFASSLLRPFLEGIPYNTTMLSGILYICLYTSLLSPAAAVIMEIPFFTTWRKQPLQLLS